MHGSGPPLLIDSCWLSHLQFDWQSPVWRHYLVELGRFATVIRFDERGHGLSDRDVSDHSLEARIADLEAVADHAGLDRFALMAMAQGGPASIEYAARHPERLTQLLSYGSYAGALANATPEEVALDEAFTALSAETAALARTRRKSADARHLLAALDLPTLVLHSRGDQMNQFHEGRYLASHIPGARLVALESDNHIVLEDEPAWPAFVREVADFLADDRQPARHEPTGDEPAAVLSGRELDVLSWPPRAATTTRSPRA